MERPRMISKIVRGLCQPDVDCGGGYTYSGFAVLDKDDNSFTRASSYVLPLNTCRSRWS